MRTGHEAIQEFGEEIVKLAYHDPIIKAIITHWSNGDITAYDALKLMVVEMHKNKEIFRQQLIHLAWDGTWKLK